MTTKRSSALTLELYERMDRIARKYFVTVENVRSDDRTPMVVRARDEIAYMLVDELRFSYPHAGTVLGKDHTTIMQAVARFALVCGDVAYKPPSKTKARRFAIKLVG